MRTFLLLNFIAETVTWPQVAETAIAVLGLAVCLWILVAHTR